MEAAMRNVLFPLVASSLLGCGGALVEAPQDDVLGHVQTRDRRLTMHAGGRFTVRDAEGRVLDENVSGDALRAAHPELLRTYETGQALDASLHLPATPDRR
jgi:hypothetical protein